jgi:predicted RNA-binding protein with RPS1 domain
VKRAERFGVFVEVEGGSGGCCGLAHLSELSDGFVKDPAALFTVGQSEWGLGARGGGLVVW